MSEQRILVLMCTNPLCVLGTERYEIDECKSFNPTVCHFCGKPLKEIAVKDDPTMPITPSKRKKHE